MDGVERDTQRSAAGKLKAVARRWAEVRWGGCDELAEDLIAFDLADQVPAPEKATGIWPENELTVRVFFDLEFQWQKGFAPDGSAHMRLGHDQIKNTMELMGVKRREWPDVFNGIKTMESAVIEVIRESEA